MYAYGEDKRSKRVEFMHVMIGIYFYGYTGMYVIWFNEDVFLISYDRNEVHGGYDTFHLSSQHLQ